MGCEGSLGEAGRAVKESLRNAGGEQASPRMEGGLLLNKGVPDQMRAEVLGHSAGRQFATTAGYSHATLEYLRKVYEELDDLAPELWKRSKAAKGDFGAGA